jgi:hypothetical protein
MREVLEGDNPDQDLAAEEVEAMADVQATHLLAQEVDNLIDHKCYPFDNKEFKNQFLINSLKYLKLIIIL